MRYYDSEVTVCSNSNVPVFFSTSDIGATTVIFSHLPAIFLLGVLAVSIFAKNKKNILAYFVTGFMCMLLGWLVIDFVEWNTISMYTMYWTWGTSVLLEAYTYVFLFLFCLFLLDKKIPPYVYLLIGVGIIPFILGAVSDLGVAGIDSSVCLAQEGFYTEILFVYI